MISIIIPVYNGEKYIVDTIKAALAQSMPAAEIIVVDDGSKDGTAARVKEFGNAVKYFFQTNTGVSAARNHGLRKSTGSHLVFLDADDIMLPDFLEKRFTALLNNKEAAIAYGDIAVIDGNGTPTGAVLKSYAGNDMIAKLCKFTSPIPCPSNVMIRKEVFDKVGGFDTQLSTSADFDMWFRICKHFSTTRVEGISLYYRQHGTNMSRNTSLFKKDMLTYQKKFWINQFLSLKDYFELKSQGYFLLFKFQASKRQPACLTSLLVAGKAWAQKIFYMIGK
jgi:glycosyltransferase involved in cell wall biosynthesis